MARASSPIYFISCGAINVGTNDQSIPYYTQLNIIFTAETVRGTIFALWCVSNACYSIYACSWVHFLLHVRLAESLILLRRTFWWTTPSYSHIASIFSSERSLCMLITNG